MKRPSLWKQRLRRLKGRLHWLRKLGLKLLKVTPEHNHYFGQLTTLTTELTRELEEEVIFRFGKNKLNARVEAGNIVVAEVKRRRKGYNGSPYQIVFVQLNPDFVVLRSWFQMAFMGSRLAFTDLPAGSKVLLLEHKPVSNTPRER